MLNLSGKIDQDTFDLLTLVNQVTLEMGIDAVEISGRNTKTKVSRILNTNLKLESPNYLAEEMCSRIDEEYDNKLRLLEAFADGFQG